MHGLPSHDDMVAFIGYRGNSQERREACWRQVAKGSGGEHGDGIHVLAFGHTSEANLIDRLLVLAQLRARPVSRTLPYSRANGRSSALFFELGSTNANNSIFKRGCTRGRS